MNYVSCFNSTEKQRARKTEADKGKLPLKKKTKETCWKWMKYKQGWSSGNTGGTEKDTRQKKHKEQTLEQSELNTHKKITSLDPRGGIN